jgi:large subunit ribosomal protein L9
MKLLLKEDVENLGLAGEVCEVANGYGRNYLIPQGYAVKATPGVMNQAEIWRKKAEARRAEQRAEYESLAARIEEVTLTYEARAGSTGKLYGSITTAQVADDLNEALGTELDRRKIGVEPLRSLGEHKVIVRLSAEFQPNVTVIINSEEGEELVVEEIEEVIEEVIEDDEDMDDEFFYQEEYEEFIEA